MNYFPEPDTCNKNKIEVKSDVSNYATKYDLKMPQILIHQINYKSSDIDKLDTAKLEKVPNDLSSLKSKADKLDIGKLETAPVDIIKLSDVKKMILLE